MARIRTVKPELFKHDELFEAEVKSGLPIRLAYIGLFTICDKAGRFKWKARRIKVEVLPYDDGVDFELVLNTLHDYGFIKKYEVNGELFGCVPSFSRHQIINNREADSELPEPSEGKEICTNLTRGARVGHAWGTREARGLRGKEGKGKEGDSIAQSDACATDAFSSIPVDNFDGDESAEQDDAQSEQRNAQREAKRREAKELEARFEKFWEAYPRRKDRKRTREKFLSLKPSEELLQRMLAAIDAEQREKVRMKQRDGWAPDWKHPKTWLNGHCWEDEHCDSEIILQAEAAPRCQVEGCTKYPTISDGTHQNARWWCREHADERQK